MGCFCTKTHPLSSLEKNTSEKSFLEPPYYTVYSARQLNETFFEQKD